VTDRASQATVESGRANPDAKHPGLAVLGYSPAAMYLARTPPPNVTAIVTIHGRREFAVPSAAGVPRLDLSFDDVDVPPPDDDVAQIRSAARRRWAAEIGLSETAPTPADAAGIIDFARAIHESDGVVLCHCGAGMSRAPAAALILLATWRGPGAEAECAGELRRLCPAAAPHAGLVRFADAILEREGKLLAALRG
jgi:predicted protein tyrosine phosphatase